MRDFRRNTPFVKKDVGPRRNHQIRVPEVLLIDDEKGNLGIVSIQEALRLAEIAGKDLVEVSPQANPPVVKIIDYSKYVYEQKKKQKKSKVLGKVKEMKEFRFTPVIAENDIAFRVRRAKDFLDKGHNVRLTMFRKGRFTREQAEAKFREILTMFDGYSSIEPDKKMEGRKIYITLKSDGTTEKQKNSPKTDKEDQPKGE
ncbi:translation initiation factor IF-3 [Candidatus Nomurabacteria bacterium]|uniref:Translation initiation factor IF-3 n=1 Tax=Candidatus Dojkabacteria bacterium TaxID=2099670 RepID=A0A955I2Z4_9BACT|nr:translation initiation factor IF-3 [Candidatus Dojkabacteria bacterium]MCB9789902.1 translation initiation factor IF-3 [Candidatus Nomurabacteria bacterium]MCB9803475.1 translation initiation factor IF-3 [Candidatus Nomurabacteria bacterium]